VSDSVVRVQRNKNITLPLWVMRRFQIDTGDFVRIQEAEEGVLLKPAKLVDPSQAYFWSKEWQAGEREAEGDLRRGRVKRFRSVKALMKDLRS